MGKRRALEAISLPERNAAIADPMFKNELFIADDSSDDENELTAETNDRKTGWIDSQWAVSVVCTATACIILLAVAAAIALIGDPQDSWHTESPRRRDYEVCAGSTGCFCHRTLHHRYRRGGSEKLEELCAVSFAAKQTL